MWIDATSTAFREGVWASLPDSVKRRLEAFGADLIRYNRAQNLISRRAPELQLGRLLEECVMAARSLEARGLLGSRWADVGSGAGFPGLVLGAVFPAQPLTLIERRQGRCDFLRREIRALELGAVDLLDRDAAGFEGEPFDVVLAKAVAPPGEIEALCGPLLTSGGTLVVFGRPEDRAAGGWSQSWTDPLPGEGSVLRGLVRAGG